MKEGEGIVVEGALHIFSSLVPLICYHLMSLLVARMIGNGEAFTMGTSIVITCNNSKLLSKRNLLL